ncbi:hypothetical protein I6G82_07530 [Lysinibacillus macroides]|uniref:hypothetical protein n=1 Tax=Lysinibacillus macroides TaxID=33935 RepID=UPI0006B47747|nr:hypothetical protein [Lysinibacillus macroides]QPR69437.1 hypothetical protein I6G82_07530 [Lysinibacillus macroides]
MRESEAFFHKEIALPARLPSIAFTHHFGRFSHLSMPLLEITYLNEYSGYTHYEIAITSNEYKSARPTDAKTIRLDNGNQAFYYNRRKMDGYIHLKWTKKVPKKRQSKASYK